MTEEYSLELTHGKFGARKFLQTRDGDHAANDFAAVGQRKIDTAWSGKMRVGECSVEGHLFISPEES
jgi:hypothetical protein